MISRNYVVIEFHADLMYTMVYKTDCELVFTRYKI